MNTKATSVGLVPHFIAVATTTCIVLLTTEASAQSFRFSLVKPPPIVRHAAAAAAGSQVAAAIIKIVRPSPMSFGSPRVADLLESAIRDLGDLADGWLDGAGFAPNPHAVADATRILRELMVSTALPAPRVFPVPDGSVQAEWSGDGWVASARFLPNQSVRIRVTKKDAASSEIVHSERALETLRARLP